MPYTKRIAIVENFSLQDDEDALYHLVTEYLKRENLQALPTGQRTLMASVLHKLPASSTFAIADALKTMSNRPKAKVRESIPAQTLADEFDEDHEPSWIYPDRTAYRYRHYCIARGDSFPLLRENAHRTSCQSNLEQIGLGLIQYRKTMMRDWLQLVRIQTALMHQMRTITNAWGYTTLYKEHPAFYLSQLYRRPKRFFALEYIQ